MAYHSFTGNVPYCFYREFDNPRLILLTKQEREGIIPVVGKIKGRALP